MGKLKPSEYLLKRDLGEMDRLRLQARVWEPEAERMFDEIGIRVGSSALDLGCGAMGVLAPLARRVGPQGRVVGLDTDLRQLEVAREYVAEEGLDCVEVADANAYETGWPDASFDLTHVRFLFAPLGRDEALLSEVLRLTRTGGVVALEEPDGASWSCWPESVAWNRLCTATFATFEHNGGDFHVGRRLYGMLKNAGLVDVQVRASVKAIECDHPYAQLPIQFGRSLREQIVRLGLMTSAELDEAIEQCAESLMSQDRWTLSFTLVQAWGRKPSDGASKDLE